MLGFKDMRSQMKGQGVPYIFQPKKFGKNSNNNKPMPNFLYFFETTQRRKELVTLQHHAVDLV